MGIYPVTNRYVGYISAPNAKQCKAANFDYSNHIKQQEKILSSFFSNKQIFEAPKTFIELGDNRRSRHPFPELEKAIQYAVEHKCILVIAKIQTLTSNRSFAELIDNYLCSHSKDFEFKPDIYCCDQPFIRGENFTAIVSHSMQQKKMHGELIKAGLNRSNCKSGNPNAVNIINQVNKPKIDSAIVFALTLSPVINYYQSQGLSQRQMVNQLNDDGFTAPEGGKWVLSQLQKVLNRIKFNEAAIALEKQVNQFKERNLNDEQICHQLNSLSVPAPKGKEWTEELVQKIKERIRQIHNIIEFHEFIINLSPILDKYHIDELNEDVFANELQLADINIPSSYYNPENDSRAL